MYIKNTGFTKNELILFVFVISIIALIGVSKLAYPLMDDQAEFVIGAKILEKGGILYRDFTNIKPPGIFLFYLFGGSLFGFNGVGIHLFELIYMLLFALTIIFGLGNILGRRIGYVAAILSVCSYYLISSEWELTNVESIANFPLFVVLICFTYLLLDKYNNHVLSFVSGFASGTIFLLKPIYFVIPLGFLITFWFINLFVNHKKMPWISFLAGTLLPIIVIVLWFVKNNSLQFLIDALFVIPGELVRSTNPFSRIYIFINQFGLFIKNAGVIILFAGLAILFNWRSIIQYLYQFKLRALNVKVYLFLGLGLWIILGITAILAQIISWWYYHWFLLLCPLSILSAISIETLVEKNINLGYKQHILTIIIVSIVLCSLNQLELVRILTTYNNRIIALQPSRRLDYQNSLNSWYGEVNQESNFLNQPSAIKGPIYVWGSPLIYIFTGRALGATVQGWNLNLMTPGLYNRLAEDLNKKLPAYIFIAKSPSDYGSTIFRKVSFQKLLQDKYIIDHESRMGVWYRLRNNF